MRKLAILLLAATTASADYKFDRCAPPANPPSVLTLAGKDEPGEKLVISGVARDERGITLPGMFVRAFQADAKGIYSREDNNRPRLCGVARTDAQGRYRIVTIKPGPYPGDRVPAHVHFEIWGAQRETVRELLQFAGDPFLEHVAPDSGRGARVRPLMRSADGTLSCERDLIVGRPK